MEPGEFFTHVIVSIGIEHVLYPKEEFLSLPTKRRTRLILDGAVCFLNQRGEIMPTSTALRSILKMRLRPETLRNTFGAIAIRMGLATFEEISCALTKQLQENQDLRIGEILVSGRVLTSEEVHSVLNEQTERRNAAT